MRHSSKITIAAVSVAASLASVAPASAAEKPVGSITTYVTASGSTSTLECTFSDNPELNNECGRNAGDGDGYLESFRERKAVRAYTRVVYADGRLSHVLTDFVVLDNARTLLMQAVGVDNATVVFSLDGGSRMIRTRAGKRDVIANLRSERKLTKRLHKSLEGEDPYLRS